ncbi:MAG: SpaA isopeptide-forming pilin-related protein [Eubacteriales bacterium]|nr:SpaA isopeptide-forming pilin-related protein [Eubacteriales bacterium]MDD4513007.1 SpaA isopeptide-forming pilin-related protein [Eubacteriales bacterium]
MIKKTKIGVSVFLSLLITLFGVFSFPSASAAAITNAATLTYDNLLEGLGVAATTAVVAKKVTQNGHSESSVFTDEFEKNVAKPYLSSARSNINSTTFDVSVKVYLPEGHGDIDTMTFALYEKSNSSFTKFAAQTGDIVEQTITNIPASQTTLDLTFRISSSDAKTSQLFVFQHENGTYIQNGAVNSDKLTVRYGDTEISYPEAITATPAINYIGKITGSALNQEYFKIIQGTGGFYLPGTHIEFGSNVRLYYQGLYAYELLDTTYPRDLRSGQVYISDINWSGQYSYKRFEDVSYKYDSIEGKGHFYYCGDEVTFTFSDSVNKAASELDKLTTFSESLANTSLGLGGTSKGNPGTSGSSSGNSTVTGNVDEYGNVVSLYAVNTVTAGEGFKIDTSSLKSGTNPADWDNKGLPIEENEYAVFNILCPSADGKLVIPDNTLSLFTPEGKSSPNQWGSTTDSNARYYSHIIWNPVYLDNGVYKSFKGTIEYSGGSLGGVMLAPASSAILVSSVADSVTLVSQSVTNSAEIHQTSFARSDRRATNADLTMERLFGTFSFSKVQPDGWQSSHGTIPLSGAKFIVYTDPSDPEGSTVANLTSSPDGSVQSENLPVYGLDSEKIKYYIKETETSNGLSLNTAISQTPFTLDEDTNKVLFGGTVVDDFAAGSLKITKSVTNVDNDSTEFRFKISSLQPVIDLENTSDFNTVYTINDLATNQVKSSGTCSFAGSPAGFTMSSPEYISINENEYILFDNNLPLGVYTIEEILTGIPYTATTTNPGAFHVFEGSVGYAAFTNTRDMGKMHLSKIDDSDNPLENVVFTIYNKDTCETTDIVGTMTTNSSGYAESESLPTGTYYVKETAVPEGYTGVTTVWTVDVTKDGDTAVAELAIVNTRDKGKMFLYKVDEHNDYLAGVTFTIYNKEACTNADIVTTMTSVDGGRAESIDLPTGIYYVKETTAPAGYTGSTSKWRVEITKGGMTPVAIAPVLNIRDKGSVKVVKVDATTTTLKLSGAVFTLYTDADCTLKYADMPATAENGESTLSGIPTGIYYVKETTVPANYTADDTVYEITIAKGVESLVNGGTDKPGYVTNTRDLGKMHLSKVDENNKALEGAVFTIYNKDTCETADIVGTMTTNGSGYAESESLPTGTYYVKETTVPDGYTGVTKV